MADTMPDSSQSVGHRIVRAMLVIVFYWMFLKFGGFLMNIIIVNYFDHPPLYDAFTATYNNLIYLLLFSSALKTMLPAFMPLFSKRMQDEGEATAWAFANTLLTLLLSGTAVVAVVGCVYAPQVVSILLPGFTGETQAATIRLLRWMLPGTLVLSFAIMAQGILNSYKVFSYPSAADAAQKLLWVAALFIAIVVIRPEKTSPTAWNIIGGAFLVGCIGQAVVLFKGLGAKLKSCRIGLPSLSWPRIFIECAWLGGTGIILAASLILLRSVASSEVNTDFWTLTVCLAGGALYAGTLWYRGRTGGGVMRRFAVLVAPLLVGVLFARYRDLVSSFFQSGAMEGAYGMIELGKKVINLPSVLVSYSLGVAMLPFLCDIAARKKLDELGRISGRALKMVGLFLLPLAVITIVLREPVMQLLGDPGTWSAEDIGIAGLALGIPAAIIFFMAIESVLMQTYFSIQETMLPMILGVVFALAHSFGLYIIIETLGYNAPAQKFIVVCIAYPSSRALKNLLLFVLLQRRVRLFSLADTVIFSVKISAVSCAVALTGYVVYAALAAVLPAATFGEGVMMFKLGKLVLLSLSSVAGILVFVGACLLLGVDEFKTVVQWVRERGWKNTPAA